MDHLESLTHTELLPDITPIRLTAIYPMAERKPT